MYLEAFACFLILGNEREKQNKTSTMNYQGIDTDSCARCMLIFCLLQALFCIFNSLLLTCNCHASG